MIGRRMAKLKEKYAVQETEEVKVVTDTRLAEDTQPAAPVHATSASDEEPAHEAISFSEEHTQKHGDLTTPLDSSPTPTTPSARPAHSRYGSAQERKRERLLELARKNAQMPLPETVQYKTPEEPEKVKEEKRQARMAIRQRLWKLMGGYLP